MKVDEFTDTNLSVRDSSGRFARGNKPINGFDKRLKDRSNGSWKKSETARGKLEKMMILTEMELQKISGDYNSPAFEKRIASILLNDPSWNVLSSMIDQVYGRPKESVDIKDLSGNDPIIKHYVIPVLPENFIKLPDSYT